MGFRVTELSTQPGDQVIFLVEHATILLKENRLCR
jgi:hypothetical protein